MALTDLDLYLFGSGEHWRAYERFGAHPGNEDGQAGTHFAVWAPNASDVSVVADLNYWSPGAAPLKAVGESGVWQGFVPGTRVGMPYKFAIRPRGSEHWFQKADPFGFAAEYRPATASVVADLDTYKWDDAPWIAARAGMDWQAAPISVYEVHLSSWQRDPADPERFLTYRELSEVLPAYAVEMGYTHVELLPVAEHPLDMSWGYQTVGYFAPSARYGSPQDFMYLVDRCHQAGLGVILDWVPAHFPKDAHGLARFDGTALYEHADPRRGEHRDWGTLIFNYGRREVQSFLTSNVFFWIERYHIDGLRFDAVASMLYLDYSREGGDWLPNQYGGRENLDAIAFLRHVNAVLHGEYPGVLTIAEESTAWPKVSAPVDEGGLGFDFKWNMGWMHDTLEYFQFDPLYRRFHQDKLTFSMVYAFSEHFMLPLSHDEVVHGKRSLLDKMPGDVWQKFANLRAMYCYMWAHPGKKLLFMGSEFGQWREWNYGQSLDWHLLSLAGYPGEAHRGLARLVTGLNGLYTGRPALYSAETSWEGFEWIDLNDSENSVLSFVRRSADQSDELLYVFNLTPVVRHTYRLGLPAAGEYIEILNSDSRDYGGSGVANEEPVTAEEIPWRGQLFSAEVQLPPLAAIVLERTRPAPADGRGGAHADQR